MDKFCLKLIKFTTTGLVGLVLLSCGSGTDGGIEVTPAQTVESTTNADNQADNSNQPEDQADNPNSPEDQAGTTSQSPSSSNIFDNLIPSVVVGSAIINDDNTVPSSYNDFLPGFNNPDDIAAGLAEFYVDGGIAYDPEHNHLFVANQYNYLVYKIDLDLDTVTWFASSGTLVGGDIFGSAAAADPVAPKDLNLHPRDLAVSGEYLYVANFGSIAKIPKDGSSLARSEIQFASGSGIFTDAADLAGNGVPQTKGLVMPDNINVGRIESLRAYDGYLHVTDSINNALRLISIPIVSGARQVFNYYVADPAVKNPSFYSSVIHDDGYIYSLASSGSIRIFKLPPVENLSGDNYPLILDDYWFSGSTTGTATDGPAATVAFASSSGLVSANSLLFLADSSSQAMRVISDDGTVTTLPLVYEDPSPVALDGSLNILSMVYAGDNLFYATADHTVLSLNLQF